MNVHTAVGLAAAGALAAMAAGVIVYRRFAMLARRCHAALTQADFWTGAWSRDTGCLLQVCDQQEQQLTTLNERVGTLQQALERARRRARTQKQTGHTNGVAHQAGRGRNGKKPPS